MRHGTFRCTICPQINQHPYEAGSGALLEDDVANLGNVLKATQRTLLVCGKDCVALMRIW
jgi:hypothetical protein